jgi:hypothetical protein
MPNWWVYERRFRQWIDGIGYDLEIGRRGSITVFLPRWDWWYS